MRWFSGIALALVLSSQCLSAQEKDFSSWRKFTRGQLLSETTAFTPGSGGTLGLHIWLEKEWHTYWLNPGDSGTAPILTFRGPAGVRVKKVLFPAPERIVSSGLVSFAYSNEVLFLFDLEIDKSVQIGKNIELEVEAEWLVCKEVCIPAIDTFKLSVPVLDWGGVQPSSHFALFQKTRAQIPTVSAAQVKANFDKEAHLYLPALPASHEFVDFFPFKGSGFSNDKAVVGESGSELDLMFALGTVAQVSPDRLGVLLARDRKSGMISATQFGDSGWSLRSADGAANGTKHSFWWMLFSAFLGGLILNLMPCVFPILSIKLLSLLKQSASHQKEVRQQNFAYVAGVLVSFLAVAIMLFALRSAGSFVGWGFQLQSPVFLALLSWLFFVLGLNLLGVFEIDFLNMGFGQRLTRMGGMWGSFFTGVLAVVVASPCTAPFMGVALGFGLTQGFAVLVAIFLMLGLGLAFPYLVFAVFPASVRMLPKPGRWMGVVKQVMAFPLFLTVLWLIWILAQVRGVNAVIIVLLGCVALGFALWMSAWGKKFARVLAALILLGGIVHIYRSDRLVVSQVQSDVWQPYSEALMESLKGQPIFINMTADWCLTCKVNERLVFNDKEVMAKMLAKKIVLVQGDWTQRNEEITRFLTRYERVGVPFNIIFSAKHPRGLVLPEVLTKNTFLELIENEF